MFEQPTRLDFAVMLHFRGHFFGRACIHLYNTKQHGVTHSCLGLLEHIYEQNALGRHQDEELKLKKSQKQRLGC